MDIKICNICNEKKALLEFNFRKETNSYRNTCKSCQAIYNKKYRKINEASLKKKIKDDYNNNREHKLLKAKQFYENNKDRIKERARNYYYDNKDKIRITKRSYNKIKLKIDNVYKTTRNLRNRLWYALNNKGWKKSSSFAQYIGLTDYNELKLFLEKNFTPEMNWDNYGKYWDIDHIIPLSHAKTEDDLYKLCHYTNLYPREKIENRINKKDKFDFNTELIVTLIDYNQGQDFLKQYHYLKNEAPAEYTFGAFLKNGTLVGVCTFHTPFSPGLKKMICGEEFVEEVIELNRLAMVDTLPTNSESWFVSQCLQSGEIKKHIIVTFADTKQKHKGTIYQALNFIYTGLTDKKREFSVKNINKHATTLALNNTASELKGMFGEDFSYKDRSRKHRYVYFNTDKRTRRLLLKHFKLNKKPYPK